jgi:hypothetical protein
MKSNLWQDVTVQTGTESISRSTFSMHVGDDNIHNSKEAFERSSDLHRIQGGTDKE